MAEFIYRKSDAFTSGQSRGNPAACIYLSADGNLSSRQMQEIAAQHKGFVSEVVFCSPSAQKDFDLAYYSSECEVDFCGHGTIACMYSLIKNSPELLARKEIGIHTARKGDLTVYNFIADRDAVYITAPSPQFCGTDIDSADIAATLGIDLPVVTGTYPVDMIDAGLRTLIVPICSLEQEISIFPDETSLKAFCIKNNIDIILIFSMDVSCAGSIAHTRVFAPKFGYLEDPATGSGNSAFAYYLLKNNLWDGCPASIEQGGNDRIFNVVKITTLSGKVLFGGRATDRITGIYIV